jgi:serine/threonine protein kinase/tetratricopeptide (TPR) repeat protein
MECPKCEFKNPDNTKYCGNCATPLPLSEGTLDAQTETLVVPIVDMYTGSILAGRYEIIEELGKGGMGKVYKARDKEINEKIAIKIIRPDIATNKKIIERFHNELKMARTITHKNVCRMHDLGRDEDTRFITMEYVSGEDLKKSIRRMGPLTVRKALSIGKQICHGLSEAHHLGVYHRDLKPHNIMIDREGNAKIMDFGIALSSEADGITDSNIIIGTPQYLSPEQVEGKKVDQRSDIYSLGVILFEMVTGQVPFDGDTTLSIAVKHKSEIPRNPKEFNALIPEELSQLILKCMEKDSEKRYQTVDELCSDLTEIAEQIPTTETTITKRRVRSKFTGMEGNQPRIFVSLLFLILILVGGYFFYTKVLRPVSQETLQPEMTQWKNSIAILPFQVLSLDEEHRHLCEGILDDIIVKLRMISPELRVSSKRAVMKYNNVDIDIDKIGQELEVTTILEPSFQMEGDTIRVRALLTNIEDKFVLDTFDYEEKMEGIFSIQDQITQALTEKLRVHFEEGQVLAAKKRETKNIEAYSFYSKGRYFERVYRESQKEEDFQSALINFNKAIEFDPDYALAYVGLGNIHEYRFVNKKEERDRDLLKGYFKTAYEKNPDIADTNIGLSWNYFYIKEYDKASEYVKRAYWIDPNNSETNRELGSFFRSIGLYQKAVYYHTRALELEPSDVENHMYQVRCYRILGEFDAADTSIREVINKNPEDLDIKLQYARLLIWMGHYVEAEEIIDRVEMIDPALPAIKYARALALAVRGKKKEALELAFIPGVDHMYYIYTLMANVYCALGMKNEAYSLIEDGIENGYERIQMHLFTYQYLMNNPFFDILRGDTRFQEILKIEKERYDKLLRQLRDL